MVTTAAGLITRGLGYAVIALFVAIYLAAQPERYRHLCLRLVPPAHRPTAEHLFSVVGQILQRWLVGQFVVMLTIGVLSGIGLWMMGIEAAFALGLMFDTALLLHGLLQGGVVMLAALGIFQLGIHDEHGEQVARCMAFVTLVIGNLGLVLTNRSMTSSAFRVLTRPNRALIFVIITTMTALILAISVPWLRGLFGFAPLGWPRLAEAAGASLVCIVVNDLIGVIWRWITGRMAERKAHS